MENLRREGRPEPPRKSTISASAEGSSIWRSPARSTRSMPGDDLHKRHQAMAAHVACRHPVFLRTPLPGGLIALVYGRVDRAIATGQFGRLIRLAGFGRASR